MKILIAEDDEVLAREIQMACMRWKFDAKLSSFWTKGKESFWYEKSKELSICIYHRLKAPIVISERSHYSNVRKNPKLMLTHLPFRAYSILIHNLKSPSIMLCIVLINSLRFSSLCNS